MVINKISRLKFLNKLVNKKGFGVNEFVLFDDNNEVIKFNFESFIERYFLKDCFIKGTTNKIDIIYFNKKTYLIDYFLDKDIDITAFFDFYIKKYYEEVL